ncbi:hypothetical protein CEP52_012130 [Fusarium oligoseptatum]|uniref:Uncharacterized protein n=1 Tax=Fusarium oligoseptatum TaxID=2604345 RepID=A0A428SZT2_9HYPO|nr:hypothetical protein CEP52_012130 [Fusarium oligoseptatum]
MVHVVCAVLFYVCWFRKPLNVQEPLVVKMGDFESEIALKVQQHFYSWACYHMALFEAPKSDYQAPPQGLDEKPMKWIMPEIGSKMYYGNILPSGVALYGHDTRHYGMHDTPDYLTQPFYEHSNRQSSEFLRKQSSDSSDDALLSPFIDRGYIEISEEFIRRWDSILKGFPFENRRELAITAPNVVLSDVDEPLRLPGVLPSDGPSLPLYLSRLDEFVPQNDTDTFSELPFTNRGGNLDFKTLKDEEKSYGFYLFILRPTLHPLEHTLGTRPSNDHVSHIRRSTSLSVELGLSHKRRETRLEDQLYNCGLRVARIFLRHRRRPVHHVRGLFD